VVYVNDIVITKHDVQEISDLKSYLQQRLQTKDLGSLRYFLKIEFVRSKKGISLSQRKYVLDMLLEVGMFVCKLWMHDGSKIEAIF